VPSEQDKSREQKAAEFDVESFRKDLGPFVVAAETSRMAMVFTDAKESNHPLIFSNDSFLSLAGYSREEVLGQRFDFLLGRPAEPAAPAQIEAAFAGSAESDFEVCFRRKDSSTFWAAVFISPIRDCKFASNIASEFTDCAATKLSACCSRRSTLKSSSRIASSSAQSGADDIRGRNLENSLFNYTSRPRKSLISRGCLRSGKRR